MAYTAKIAGLDQVLRNIERYSKELADGIDKEISTGAKNIAVSAALKAPKGKSGELGGSISVLNPVKYSYAVSVSAPYAPFVEFGTGLRVFKTPEFNFTPEIRAYARQFFVSGKGRLYPTPFLFPAYEYEKLQIVKRVKAILFKDKKV